MPPMELCSRRLLQSHQLAFFKLVDGDGFSGRLFPGCANRAANLQ
jgi:hypothetical protein